MVLCVVCFVSSVFLPKKLCLLVPSTLGSNSPRRADCLTAKVKVLSSFETVGAILLTTQHNISGSLNPQQDACENLKSCMTLCCRL